MIIREVAHFGESDLGRIFPMTNAASARLMRLKARRLCEAGFITAAMKAEVDRRASQVTSSAVHRTAARLAAPAECVAMV
jgi:hypothetical protein